MSVEDSVERLRSAFATYFNYWDVLLCPIVPFTVPTNGETKYQAAGEVVEPALMMRATIPFPFNLTELPALNVPFAMSEAGLPIVVQLVSRWSTWIRSFGSAC